MILSMTQLYETTDLEVLKAQLELRTERWKSGAKEDFPGHFAMEQRALAIRIHTLEHPQRRKERGLA